MSGSRCVAAPWGSLLSVSSGVDWLSCSAPLSDEDFSLYAVARRLVLLESERGNFRKPWKLKGLVGEICGPVVAARSATLCFASVSGPAAGEYFPILFPSAAHVSRLDVQVTARFEPGAAKNLIRESYHAAFRPTVNGRPPARSLLTDDTGGATCYIGKRKSDVFGRAYDKGVQAHTDPAGTVVRFEVEMKNDTATLTAKELATVEDIAAEAAAITCGRWYQWGVALPCSRWSSLTSQIADRKKDSARTLEWLRTAVRPSVDRLRSLGLDHAVREALGLADTTWTASPQGPLPN